MHELNLSLNILDIASAQAQQEHCHRIKKIWLEIGDLVGIELDALQFSFSVVASQSIAKNAVLEIKFVEGRAWCSQCQKNVTIKTYFDPCTLCGCYDYCIVEGKELKIIKMEVE